MRAAARLERAVLASAERAGAQIAIAAHRSDEWRSITFAGTRHVLEAQAPASAALEQWIAGLCDDAIRVPGHLVAELRVSGCERAAGEARFRIEGVTLALG